MITLFAELKFRERPFWKDFEFHLVRERRIKSDLVVYYCRFQANRQQPAVIPPPPPPPQPSVNQQSSTLQRSVEESVQLLTESIATDITRLQSLQVVSNLLQDDFRQELESLVQVLKISLNQLNTSRSSSSSYFRHVRLILEVKFKKKIRFCKPLLFLFTSLILF